MRRWRSGSSSKNMSLILAVYEDGSPILDRPIVEPWKCPYHNGRMCIEVLGRIKEN